jgi:chromosome segregation ATPase
MGAMPDDDELARRVRKLVIEHAETRWFTLRLDNDVQEIREVQREHTARFDAVDRRFDAVDRRFEAVDRRFDAVDRRLDEHESLLQEHTGRFDSVDAQLRSLTQLVGKVLDRLPDQPDGSAPAPG